MRAILNLRRGPDPVFEGIEALHVPAPDQEENYDTHRPHVRRWLRRATAVVAETPGPILVHCTAGRDRTGVVIAWILTVLGLPREAIREEYALSTGTDDLGRIDRALDGFRARSADLEDPTTAARLRDRLSIPR